MRGEQTKIFVGNLTAEVTKEELQTLFEKYGTVDECDIVKNFGFVHMSTEEESNAAIEGLNKSEFMGSEISVEASHSKVRQRPGMGNRGQCFRCGQSGHWSKECPKGFGGGRGGYSGRGGYGRGGDGYGGYGGYGGGGYGGGYGGGSQMGGGYRDRMMGRYPDRSRPYPDPYQRSMPPSQPPPPRDDYYARYAAAPPAPPRDDYYDRYSAPPAAAPSLYSRRSPPPPAPASRFAYDTYDTAAPRYAGPAASPSRPAPY